MVTLILCLSFKTAEAETVLEGFYLTWYGQEAGNITAMGTTPQSYYTIAVDPKGKLRWKSGFFCILEEYGRTQKAHAVTILTEEVKDDYLAYLKSIEVSYIFAGKDKIDIKEALRKLKKLFGIERVLCEGGPTTNGYLIKEDLVQKVIFYQCPYIATPGNKPIFGEAKLSKWNLETFEMLPDKSTLILSYVKV